MVLSVFASYSRDKTTNRQKKAQKRRLVIWQNSHTVFQAIERQMQYKTNEELERKTFFSRFQAGFTETKTTQLSRKEFHETDMNNNLTSQKSGIDYQLKKQMPIWIICKVLKSDFNDHYGEVKILRNFSNLSLNYSTTTPLNTWNRSTGRWTGGVSTNVFITPKGKASLSLQRQRGEVR